MGWSASKLALVQINPLLRNNLRLGTPDERTDHHARSHNQRQRECRQHDSRNGDRNLVRVWLPFVTRWNADVVFYVETLAASNVVSDQRFIHKLLNLRRTASSRTYMSQKWMHIQ